MNAKEIRTKLIQNGIKNLTEFGYVGVDEKNILSDYVFCAFFKSNLESDETIAGVKQLPKIVDQVRLSLLAEIEKNPLKLDDDEKPKGKRKKK